MIEALKKTILAGLGAAVITKDKVQASLEDLVRQGKITAAEARAAAEKIADESRNEFEQASGRIGDKLRDLFSAAESSHEIRIEALEKRVAALEAKAASGPN